MVSTYLCSIGPVQFILQPRFLLYLLIVIGMFQLRLNHQPSAPVHVPLASTDATADVVREIAVESGRTPAQIALNWVTNRPQVTSSLIGARTVDQLDDNLGSVGWRPGPQ